MDKYALQFRVKWSEVDANMHLRHSVYLDYTDHVRINFFDATGVSVLSFRKRQVGPVLFGMTSNFSREVLLNELVTVNLKMSKLSNDMRKWQISHEVFKENGELAATVVAHGAWLDLAKRKVIVPPEDILEAVQLMEKSDDFSIDG